MLNRLYRKWFSPTLGQTSELRRQRLAPKKLINRRRPHLELLEDRVVPSTFGNFNIDGSLTGSGSPSPYDWNHLNGPSSFALPKIDTVQNDVFNSAMDDQFTSGQKESQATFTVSVGSSPSKADITRMYVGHSAIPTSATTSDVYVFLGFNRFNSSGDTFTDFELNQGAATYNAGTASNPLFLPYRTSGDLLITFDFSGSTAIGLLSWSGNSTSGNWVNPTTGAVGVPQSIPSTIGVGAVNTTTVNNPFSLPNNSFQSTTVPFADNSNPSTFAAGLFGEAAINLTKALPSGANGTFNWVYMSTRSSSSYSSSLKDIIKPYSIVIPLKGDIRGNVFQDLNASGNQEASENGLNGWTVQLLDSTNTVIKTATTATIGAVDGAYAFTGLNLGNYTVREVLQGTYVQTSPTLSTTFPPGEPVSVIATGTPDTAAYGASYSATIQPGFSDEGLNFGNRLKGDLSITKTDGVASATAGASTTYTIVVSNSGPSTASNVVVSDTLPTSNATSMTWSGNGHTNVSGNLSDTIASLASGASVTYMVKVNISATATGTLSNIATVAAGGTFVDTNPANNSATDTDSLGAQADLSITKTDGVSTAVPGMSTTYTIVVSNAGPSTATSVAVSDPLPAGVTSATWSGDGHTSVSGALSDTIATLASGASVTYTMTVQISPSATGHLINIATVSAAADSSPGNNSATDDDTLTPQADVSITKTDNAPSAVPGTSTTYTIVVSNAGPSTATSVAVSDLLPTGVTSATWSGDGHTNVSGALSDTIASLAPGASVTYTVTDQISPSATGYLVNTATVSAPADTTTGNNSASDTDTLTPQADISISKSDGVTSVVPGMSTTYTIVVTNNGGPSTATNVAVSDPLAAGVTSAIWSGNGQTNVSGALSDTIASLAPGASVAYMVTVQISPSATGSLVNTATVSAPADTTPGNNTATDTDTLTPPDITVTKTGNGTISAGETATWTIVVSNNGTGAALGVVLTDPTPTSDIIWTASAGTFSSSGTNTGQGTLTDTIGTLAVGASITITVSGTTTNQDPPAITNTATATATNEASGASDEATITVNATKPVLSGLTDQPAAEGASKSFTLGSFTSVSTGTFNVDVSWGDGTADTTYTVTTTTANALTSLGSKSHTYAEEGPDTVTVTVTDPYNVSGSGTFNVSVSDQQLTNMASANLPITGTEATAIGAITGLATFTDPAGPESISDYTATINWGDSTTSTGTVVSQGGGNYSVDAPDHTYAEEGTYTVNVTLTHDALASVTTPNQTIMIADPFTFGKYPNVNGLLSGDSVTLTRSFSDPAVTDAPWTVTIDDGNGGTLTPAVSVNQNFKFTLSYPTANTYTVTVTVQDADGDAHVNHFTVSVDTPQLVLGGPVTSHPSTAMLTQQQLKPIVAAAINAWRAAGASPAQLNTLSHESIQIVPLTHPGLVGGTNPQGIQIDPTAAGHGWFIGTANSPAQGRVDLLSVVVHEMGNVLGLPEDNGNDVMGKWLATGERRLPVRGDLANALLLQGSNPWHLATSGSSVAGSSSGNLVLSPISASMLGMGSPTAVLPATAAAQAKALDDVFGLPLAQLLQDDNVLYAMLS